MPQRCSLTDPNGSAAVLCRCHRSSRISLNLSRPVPAAEQALALTPSPPASPARPPHPAVARAHPLCRIHDHTFPVFVACCFYLTWILFPESAWRWSVLGRRHPAVPPGVYRHLTEQPDLSEYTPQGTGPQKKFVAGRAGEAPPTGGAKGL